jgi:hypothetical protein
MARPVPAARLVGREGFLNVIVDAIFASILRGNWAADLRVKHELPIRAAIRIVYLPVGGFDFSYVKENLIAVLCISRICIPSPQPAA